MLVEGPHALVLAHRGVLPLGCDRAVRVGIAYDLARVDVDLAKRGAPTTARPALVSRVHADWLSIRDNPARIGEECEARGLARVVEVSDAR